MLGAGSGALVAAVLCLRLGWRRSKVVVTAGWAIGLAALGWLTWRWGLWGISIGSLIAMAAALALLAMDGMASQRTDRPLKARATVTPPRWRIEGLVRRASVFLLVVPVGFAATMVLALGVEATARRAGWGEADRTVLTLMLQPAAWAVLACGQMLSAHPRGMVVPALACTLGGAALWWL